MSERDDLDRLRGSSVPSKVGEIGRELGQDTEPMQPRLEAATDAHRVREELRKEVDRIERGLDHRIRTLEVAMIGSDVQPGVYSMVRDMREDVAELGRSIRDERKDRLEAQKADRKERTDDQRWRDMVTYLSAGAAIVCAIMQIAMMVALFGK